MGFLSQAARTITPQSNYNAAVPTIQQQNLQPRIDQGQAAVNAGIGNLNNIAGQQQGLAGEQSGLLPQQQAILGGQQNIGAQQQSLARMLLAQANGAGPNPAQAQYMQNAAAAGQEAAGNIASTQGLNRALAARMAAQQEGGALQNAAGNAATLQAQQQLGFENALQGQQQAMGQTLGQENQTVAGMQNTYSGMNNALNSAAGTYGNAGNLGLGGLQTAQGAQTGQNEVMTQGQLGASQINSGTANANSRNGTETLNKSIMPGVGGVLNSAGRAVGLFAEGGYVHRSLGHALLASGGAVPGHAAVPGNSYTNDTVPTMLSPGEIVLPRSITQSPDAAAKAAEFVKALQKGSKK